MVDEARAKEIGALLDRLVRWVERREDVRALALVGSWARGEPHAESDVDVVLLTDAPAAYVEREDWLAQIGAERIVHTAAWGVVTERRCALSSGLEVELCIGTPTWAAIAPLDGGTRRVVRDGIRILYDPDGLLAALAVAGQRTHAIVAELRTDRLLLRGWRPCDRDPFAVLNADLDVMRYLPAPLTRAESDRLAERLERGLEQDGWGLWALEERSTHRFLGFTGLARPGFEAHFTPAVEIGWRLGRDAWGRGFATEAARAAMAFAFEELALHEVVSFTTQGNARSRAVMERLRMRHDAAEDFDHPAVPAGHPLRRHVLYRASRTAHTERARG